MITFIGNIFKSKHRYMIKYRWNSESYTTGWDVYKIFKNRNIRDTIFKRISEQKKNDFL